MIQKPEIIGYMPYSEPPEPMHWVLIAIVFGVVLWIMWP